MRSKRYIPETKTNADYTNDLVLIANTLSDAEFLQHNLEPAARSTDPYVNVDKTKFMKESSQIYFASP